MAPFLHSCVKTHKTTCWTILYAFVTLCAALPPPPPPSPTQTHTHTAAPNTTIYSLAWDTAAAWSASSSECLQHWDIWIRHNAWQQPALAPHSLRWAAGIVAIQRGLFLLGSLFIYLNALWPSFTSLCFLPLLLLFFFSLFSSFSSLNPGPLCIK